MHEIKREQQTVGENVEGQIMQPEGLTLATVKNSHTGEHCLSLAIHEAGDENALNIILTEDDASTLLAMLQEAIPVIAHHNNTIQN